jgi:hypothetical protein
MTSEGNVVDTGILKKANQLIKEGTAADMASALKILKEQAKLDKNQAEMQKIKTTQKAFDGRRSRHSRKKKKTKR